MLNCSGTFDMKSFDSLCISLFASLNLPSLCSQQLARPDWSCLFIKYWYSSGVRRVETRRVSGGLLERAPIIILCWPRSAPFIVNLVIQTSFRPQSELRHGSKSSRGRKSTDHESCMMRTCSILDDAIVDAIWETIDLILLLVKRSILHCNRLFASGLSMYCHIYYSAHHDPITHLIVYSLSTDHLPLTISNKPVPDEHWRSLLYSTGLIDWVSVSLLYHIILYIP